MFSTRPFVVYLLKFVAKLTLVTAVLALLTLYPLWTAMATGGLIYLSAVSVITVEQALAGTAVLSFAQSVWLAKLKYEYKTSNSDD